MGKLYLYLQGTKIKSGAGNAFKKLVLMVLTYLASTIGIVHRTSSF